MRKQFILRKKRYSVFIIRSFNMKLKLLIVLLFHSSVSCEIVEISNGKINGTTEIFNKKPFYVFYSIPYAKPPIDKLRFKAPEPAVDWKGVLDATKRRPYCVQRKFNRNTASEDCLHLNVYTKSLNASQPVVVFIHGGSLQGGAGSSFCKINSICP